MGKMLVGMVDGMVGLIVGILIWLSGYVKFGGVFNNAKQVVGR
jgi:hypothetical protein